MTYSSPYLKQTYSSTLPVSTLHSLDAADMDQREWLLNLLAENQQQDLLTNFSWSKELKQFGGFLNNIVFSFGAGMVMRKIVRRNKRLNHILQFKELQQVRSNIEKGSFAYDTLLFGLKPWQVLENKSHLANLVCLAILFGDEFIDGIAQLYGKQEVRAILANPKIDFSLRFKLTEHGAELYYEFDIRELLPDWVLDSVNEKYGISYRDFYAHLLFLLTEMNLHLGKLLAHQIKPAASLICQVCNKCFDTYKTDLAQYRHDYSMEELLSYQQRKDDQIIQVLLELRCVLLNKHLKTYQRHFANWSLMVRSMQVYDDMQDLALDCGYQMNFVCYFAHQFFPKEWHWLQEHQAELTQLKGLEQQMMVSLNMPASVLMSMQYAKQLVQGNLNWVQQKITGYLWKKNWFGWNKDLSAAEREAFGAVARLEMGKLSLSFTEKIQLLQSKILSVKDPLISEDLLFTHLANTVLLDPELCKNFMSSLNTKDRYFLKEQFFSFPTQQKAALVKRWLLQLGY